MINRVFVILGIAVVCIVFIWSALSVYKANGSDGNPTRCFPPPDVVCTGEVHFGDRGMSVKGCSLYGDVVTLQCSNGLCCAFKPEANK